MGKSTRTTCRKTKREYVLVIAEHGVDLAGRLAELERTGCRVDRLVQLETELPGAFSRRLADALRSMRERHDRTIFVAREPVGARLNELVRTIVCSMRPGPRLLLASDHSSPYATRALAALALTVMEMAYGADVVVEGASRELGPTRAWRRRLDRALDGLSLPLASARRAG